MSGPSGSYHGKALYDKGHVAKYATHDQAENLWLSKTSADHRGNPQLDSQIRLDSNQSRNLSRAAPELNQHAYKGHSTPFYDLDSGSVADQPGTGKYAHVQNDSRYFASQGVTPKYSHNVHVREYRDGYPTKEGAALNSDTFGQLRRDHLPQ